MSAGRFDLHLEVRLLTVTRVQFMALNLAHDLLALVASFQTAITLLASCRSITIVDTVVNDENPIAVDLGLRVVPGSSLLLDKLVTRASSAIALHLSLG